MSSFKKATRKQSKLRMALAGPPKSGKSLTSLRFAFAMSTNVAAIDTERDRLAFYQGKSPDGVSFDFSVNNLEDHSPSAFTSAIEEAGRDGFDVLIIDSLSHAWIGEGGALDIVDRSSNSFTDGWKKATPMQRRMVDAILRSPCHVIVTLRTDQEYVVEMNEKGKTVPRRVGTKPLQRKGMEYEFDVFCELDTNNILTVSGTRIDAINGLVVSKPGADFMKPVIEFLNGGEPQPQQELIPTVATSEQINQIVQLGAKLHLNVDAIEKRTNADYGARHLRDLTPEQADEVIARMSERLNPPKEQ